MNHLQGLYGTNKNLAKNIFDYLTNLDFPEGKTAETSAIFFGARVRSL